MERFDRAFGWVRRHERWLGRGVTAAILAIVAWRLSEIGWRDVLGKVPETPWFYLIYALSFATLPVSERLIFATIWPAAPRATFAALVRKRALNNMVVSYSGDLFFFLWVRRHLGLPERRVLAGIKDSSVLSAIASGLLNAGLAAAFFLSGSAGVIDRVLAGHRASLWAALAGVALLVPVFLRFRRRILWIDGRQATRVFAIHVARNLIVLLLQLAQWAAVLPQVPVQTWLLFLTVQMLVSNLPLLPNRDFLFLAVGVGLVGATAVDEAALAAMLVVMTCLKQATNLAALVVTSVLPGLDVPKGARLPTPADDQSTQSSPMSR